MAIRVNGTVRDVTAPTLESAVITDATGSQFRSLLTLKFNEPLEPNSPDHKAFTVTVDGTGVPVENVLIASDGRTLYLAFQPTVSPDATVTVRYTTPTNPAQAVKDRAGNLLETFPDFAVTNQVSPSVAQEAITSDPGAGDLYALGEPIDVSLTFNTKVTVDTTSGTPRLKIRLAAGASGERWADYRSGSGTKVLVFRYTPAAGDSSDGVAVVPSSLELNGGTIKSTESSADATLANRALLHDPEHKVDTTAPTLTEVVCTSDGDSLRLWLIYNEDLDANSSPHSSQWTWLVGSGNITALVSSIEDNRVGLRSSTASTANCADTHRLRYSYDASNSLHKPIRDVAGNDAAVFPNAADQKTARRVSDPAFAAATASFSIDENNAASASVGTVTASDADGDTLTYSLAPSSDAESFTIDSATGEITVESTVTLNHENQASYTVTAWVNDGKDSWGQTLPAAASGTLVSNLGQTSSGGVEIGGGRADARAQVFTTGDYAVGYLLDHVSLFVQNWNGTLANATVAVWSTTAGGEPDSPLYALTNPATAASGTANAFSAPPGAKLEPNTAYAVVVRNSHPSSHLTLSRTASDAEDDLPHGWSIADDPLFRLLPTNNWDHSASHAMQMAVTATEIVFDDSIAVTINVDNVNEPPTAAPADLAVTDQTSRTLDLSWTAVAAAAGGPAPNAYDVRWFEGSNDPTNVADWVEPGEAGGHSSPGAGVTTTLGGLEPATAYRVQVRANSADGPGPWSASIDASTSDEPDITLTVTPATITEGGSATVTVRASRVVADNADAVTVQVTVQSASTATSGTDYTAFTVPAINIGAGAAFAEETFTLSTTGDSTHEADETIVLGADVDDWGVIPATITITDDDLPSITISGPSAVTEGDPAAFTVTADQAPVADLTVSLTVSEPAGSDFVAATNEGAKTVTITAGSTTATHSVPTQSNTMLEPDGSVTAAVETGAGYTVGAASSATVTVEALAGASGVAITSDPGAGDLYALGEPIDVSVTFSENLTVGTASGTPRLKIRLADDASAEKWASYHSGSGSGVLVFRYTPAAGDSSDGVAVMANSLVLNGGTIKETATTDDALLGHPGLDHDAEHKIETTAPTLVEAVCARSDTLGRDVATLIFSEALDSDSRPISSQFTLTVSGSSVNLTFSRIDDYRVVLAAASSIECTATGNTLAYDYMASAAGHMPIQDVAGNDAATFAGASAVAVRHVSDPAFAAATATFSINENNADGASVGTVTATDADGDTLVYSLAPDGDSQSFTIDNTTGEIKVAPTVTLNRETKASYTVTAQVTDRDDPWGQPITLSEILLQASNTGQSRADSVNVGPTIDAQAQAFTTGNLADGYVLGGVSVFIDKWNGTLSNVTASLWSTNADGDPDSELYALINPATAVDNAESSFNAPLGTTLEPNTAYAVVLRNSHATNNLELARTAANAEDDRGTDWSIADRRRVRSGESSSWDDSLSGALMISVVAEEYLRPDDTIAVTINVGNVNEPPTAAPTGLAVTDQTSRTLDLSWTAVAAAAGGPAPNAYDVRWFEGSNDPTGSQTWSDGHSTTGAGVTTTLGGLKPNTVYRVAVRANSPDGPGPWSDSIGASTSDEPDITLTVTPATITEGGSATVTVRASRVVAENADAVTVQVTVQTAASTATSGTDYTAFTVPAINIGANAAFAEETFTLSTTGDSTHEADETIVLGADVDDWGVVPATITITDDDPPSITIAGGSAVTEGTAATFTVTAAPAPVADITVKLTVSDAAGSDFVAATNEGNKTVTITAGSTTATYSVATVGDSTHELNGSVTVAVATGTGYVVGAASSGSVTVNDDDNDPPKVANAISDQTAGASAAFSFQFPANVFSDADGDTLTYTATKSDGTDLPMWLSFDGGDADVLGHTGVGRHRDGVGEGDRQRRHRVGERRV